MKILKASEALGFLYFLISSYLTKFLMITSSTLPNSLKKIPNLTYLGSPFEDKYPK